MRRSCQGPREARSPTPFPRRGSRRPAEIASLAAALLAVLSSALFGCREQAPPPRRPPAPPGPASTAGTASTEAPAAGAAGPGEGATPAAPGIDAGARALFERVLELNLVQEPELDVEEARRAFADLVERARGRVSSAETPRAKVAALNEAVLTGRDVSYVSNKYWRDSTLAAALVRGEGNCVSTATLYVLVARALGLPVGMVDIPRHVFARWDDGATRVNVETTTGGGELPDAHYLDGLSRMDVEKLGLGRTLDDDGFLAAVLRITAAHYVGRGMHEEALPLLDEALALAPGRSDTTLFRARVLADASGDRKRLRREVGAVLGGRPPPSVATDALVLLAGEAADAGDHDREREILLAAFVAAPKAMQEQVLTRLAFCHRALRDFRGAVRYMELVAAMRPEDDATLYNLAILQKNDGRLSEALETIRKARKLNPESWNLLTIEAGYLVLNGQREEGLALFATLQKPRADEEFYAIQCAWFHAVSRERERFYELFTAALESARSPHILSWIDQDVDLDVYRDEPEFRALVAKHRARLTGVRAGEPEPAAAPPVR